MKSVKWQRLQLDPFQLRLPVVLRCGQSFRWRCIDDVWSIGLKNRVLLLRQDEAALYFASVGPGMPELADEALVRDYFQLDVDLKQLHRDWSKDKRFVSLHQGVRILRQDPWETLCSFICSSNNNIKRISKMVNSLCEEFGALIASHGGHTYHDFPAPAVLAAEGVEERLRALGFGYRAKYINQTARMIADMVHGLDYLQTLRTEEYTTAHAKLLEFCGVGPKVADCVCLMALDKTDCVPVDTHVYQIATRDYKMKFRANAEGYKKVQEAFRALWGPYAGWAHSVLFTGDLRSLDNGINISTPVKTEADVLKHEFADLNATAVKTSAP